MGLRPVNTYTHPTFGDICVGDYLYTYSAAKKLIEVKVIYIDSHERWPLLGILLTNVEYGDNVENRQNFGGMPDSAFCDKETPQKLKKRYGHDVSVVVMGDTSNIHSVHRIKQYVVDDLVQQLEYEVK